KTRSLLAPRCRENWLNIDAPVPRYLIEKFIYPFLYRALVRTGILSMHYENGDEYTVQEGRIRAVQILKGYFQSTQRQAPDLRKRLYLKESLRRRAGKVFENIPAGKAPVFVHLRRSDKGWETFEGRAVQIPDHYYLAAIDRLRRRDPDLFFFFLGDDPDHADSLFRDVRPRYVSRLSVEEDLALMSLCDGGVLSNSTFSWWGAFFSSSRIGYIAPKYWAGWNVKRWVPLELRGSFVAEYLDIE
ncbi:MAG: alpha-1,2-fucosyltransferase, partial [Spirochaetia bacterium]